MSEKRSDMLFLSALLKISYIASAAPHYDFNKKETHRSKFYIAYTICTLVLILGAFIICSLTWVQPNRSDTSQAQHIGYLLEVLSSLLLAIGAIFAVSGAIFMSKTWQNLLQQLQNLNVKLGFYESNSVKNSEKILKIIFIFLPLICKDIYCIVVYKIVGPEKMSPYFICNCIFEWYCFVPTTLVVLLALSLRDRYQVLVETLEKFEKRKGTLEKLDSNVNTNELLVNMTCSSYLRNISKLYRSLSSILDKYNAVFGYQILFMLGYTLLSVLKSFNYCLKQTDSNGITNVLLANLCMTGFNLVKLV